MGEMISQREIKKAFEQLLETPEMTQILKARLEVLYPSSSKPPAERNRKI